MSSNPSKNTRYSTTEIIEYVVEYRKIMKELDGLKKEIQLLRNRLKPRMTKLVQDKEKFEDIILQHLEKQQDPGLKFQDTIIYKEPRKFVEPKKEKDDKLTQLLSSYNINDPNLLKEVTDLMRSKKIIDQSRFILKMKSLS
jgi:uridine kinase